MRERKKEGREIKKEKANLKIIATNQDKCVDAMPDLCCYYAEWMFGFIIVGTLGLVTTLNYWVGQKVHLGFSITSYRKNWRNVLANPIHIFTQGTEGIAIQRNIEVKLKKIRMLGKKNQELSNTKLDHLEWKRD